MTTTISPTIPVVSPAPKSPTGSVVPIVQGQASYAGGQMTPQVGTPEYKKAQELAGQATAKPASVVPTSKATKPVQTESSLLNKEADNILTQAQEVDRGYEEALNKQNKLLDDIRTGTVPLSPYEQAQLDSTKTIMQAVIEEQKLANKNYEGGVTVANEARGLSRYSPEMAQGEIFAAVSEGNKKILNLNAQMAQSLSQMESGFRDNNFKKVQESFQYITAAKEEKTKALENMYKTVLTKQEALQKANQDALLADVNSVLIDDAYSFADKKAYIGKVMASGQLTPEQIKEVQATIKDAQAVQAKTDEGFQAIMKTISENKNLTPQQRKAGVQEINDIQRKGGDIKEAYFASSDYLGELGIGGNELLTISEAKDLGLPYGTTRNEAIKLNRVPGQISATIDPEVAKGNAQDFQTMSRAYESINGTLKSATGKDINNITKKDISKLSTSDIESIAKLAVRVQLPDVARGSGDPKASLAQTSKIAWTARFLASQIGLASKYDPDQVIDLLKNVDSIYKDAEINLKPGSVGAENITLAPDGEVIEIID